MAKIPGGGLAPDDLVRRSRNLGCVADLQVVVGPLETRTLVEISRPGSSNGGGQMLCPPNAM